MKLKGMTWLSSVLAFCVAAAPAWSATICGKASGPQGPAAGVVVLVKDANGNVLNQTTTDQKGYYVLNGVNPGTADLFLEPGTTGFKGGSGVLDLTEVGSKVDWQVSETAAANAAQNGSCKGGWAWWEIGSVALIGLAGIGSGIGLGFGTDEDEEGPPPPPPTPISPEE